MRWGRGRDGGRGDAVGMVVVEGQETRSITASDDRSGASVRHPSDVVVAFDGLGNRPGLVEYFVNSDICILHVRE